MPVAKKERQNHKCWWQTKNGCPNQASKQLTPNEKKKKNEKNNNTQLKPLQQTKRLPTCNHKVEKNKTKNKTKQKTPPNHKSNRVLSATKEWTTTAIRGQCKKNNCANDKQMETNHS